MITIVNTNFKYGLNKKNPPCAENTKPKVEVPHPCRSQLLNVTIEFMPTHKQTYRVQCLLLFRLGQQVKTFQVCTAKIALSYEVNRHYYINYPNTDRKITTPMLFIKKVAEETSLWNRLCRCQTALVMFACVCPKIRFINIEPLSKLVFGAANIFFIEAVTLQHINHTFCIAMKGPRKYFECPGVICIGKSIPLSYQRTNLTKLFVLPKQLFSYFS